MFAVKSKIEFDSAHFLRNTNTPCDNIHGHRWEVWVTLKSEKLNKQGFVLNFTILKKWLSEIIEQYDHNLINHVLFQPTAENICFTIFQKLHKKLWYYNKKHNINVEVEEVAIAETPGNIAIFNCRDIDLKRECARRAAYKMWANPKIRENIHNGIKAANTDPILRKLRSERIIKNNPMSNRDIVEKMLKSLKKANKLSPNKQEQEVIACLKKHNLPFEFVGGGDFMIGGKIPDFINHDKRIIIEYFGRFWHSKNEWYQTHDDSQERIDHFAKYGYRCLIIWSDDWQKDNNAQIERIKAFMNEKD